jgi:hypothetical protein
VVCIALGVDRGDLLHEVRVVPHRPVGGGSLSALYSLGGQGYMKILARCELRSPTRVLLK